MDYTNLAFVKDALHIEGDADDGLIARLVTAASRMTDLVVTGSPNAIDYFKLETLTSQKARGVVDVHGNIIVNLKKNPINSISAVDYRETPVGGWNAFNLSSNADLVEVIGPHQARVWTGLSRRPSTMYVRVTYSGGYATTYDRLPADLVELVNLMAGRMYREAEGNLQDAIGVATIGQITYTRAMPERFERLIQMFQRTAPYD